MIVDGRDAPTISNSHHIHHHTGPSSPDARIFSHGLRSSGQKRTGTPLQQKGDITTFESFNRKAGKEKRWGESLFSLFVFLCLSLFLCVRVSFFLSLCLFLCLCRSWERCTKWKDNDDVMTTMMMMRRR